MSLLDELVTVAKYIDPSLAPVASGVEKVLAAVIYHLEHGDKLVKTVHDAVEAGKADAEVLAEVQHLVSPPPKDSEPSPAAPEAAAADEVAPAPSSSSPEQASTASSLSDADLAAEIQRRQLAVAPSQQTQVEQLPPDAPEVPH